jgi:hypothetical protein
VKVRKGLPLLIVVKTETGELYREELETFARERELPLEEAVEPFLRLVSEKWGIPVEKVREKILQAGVNSSGKLKKGGNWL